MARKPRVDDSELENEQLKDMMGEVEDNVDDNDEQNDQGTTGDAEGASADDDKSAGDKEDASRQLEGRRSQDKGTGDAQRGDRQQQRDKGTARGDKQTQQKGQQANVDLSLINKLDKNTQNAVMRQAVDFVRGRTQPVFNKLDMQVRKLTNALSQHEAAAKDAKEYGLNPQERNLGYRLVAAYKKDPIATIKYLLTDAKKKGHNFDLGGDGGQGIDMKAIQGMISEALGPIRGDFENRQKDQEARDAANEELVNFYADNPNAQVHEKVLNSILQRYPDETLQTAWLKVQLHAARNGISLSRPFDQQRRQQQQDNNGRPMNLRGGRNAQQRNVNGEGDAVHYANPNAKWGDIINETLAEHGFAVN